MKLREGFGRPHACGGSPFILADRRRGDCGAPAGGATEALIPSVIGPLPRRGCKWPLEFLMFIAYALAVVLALLISLSISGSLSNMGRR